MHFEWTVTAGDIIKTIPWAAILLYVWRTARRFYELPEKVDRVLDMLGDHEKRIQKIERRRGRAAEAL